MHSRRVVYLAAITGCVVAVAAWGAGPATRSGAAGARGMTGAPRSGLPTTVGAGGVVGGVTTKASGAIKNAPPALALDYAPLSGKLSDGIRQAFDQRKYGELTPFGTNPDFPPDRDMKSGGILIGLRCGVSGPQRVTLAAVQAVFLTPKGVVFGEIRGFPDLESMGYDAKPNRPTWVDLIARDGYAVSGMTISGIVTTDGVKLHYLRMGESGLDPTDGYDSNVAGRLSTDPPGQYTAAKRTSSLLPVIGMQSQTHGDRLLNIGLLSVTAPDPRPLSALPGAAARGPVTPLAAAFAEFVKQTVSKRAYPVSTYTIEVQKPDFEDLAKDGGVLIGLKYGRKAGTGPIVSVQPIFLTAAGEVTGEVHGDAAAAPKEELRAPRGYAVAGGTYGGTAMDYLELVYMKIGDRTLLPLDSYKSDLAGTWVNGGDWTSFKGDGNPVIGIGGKLEGDRLSLGLTYLRASGAETAAMRPSVPGARRGPVGTAPRP